MSVYNCFKCDYKKCNNTLLIIDEDYGYTQIIIEGNWIELEVNMKGENIAPKMSKHDILYRTICAEHKETVLTEIDKLLNGES